MNEQTISISESEAGERLDSFLAKKFPDYSRTHLSSLIKSELIKINSKSVKPSHILKTDDQITLIIAEKESSVEVIPQEIALDIIYEDENVIVINKQPGLVVHPAAGNRDNTLVNALAFHFPQIKDCVYEKGNPISESRPGLVHRLDKDTSGVIIIAKNARAMHSLSRQIQNRTVQKEYISINYGWPKDPSGSIVNNIGRSHIDRKIFTVVEAPNGKFANSEYEVQKYFVDTNGKKYSQIGFNIKTGRTHQIRVHSTVLKTPVMGDKTYHTADSERLSNRYHIDRQLLHAHKLTITLPGDNKATTFTAPIPEDITNFIKKLTIANLDN